MQFRRGRGWGDAVTPFDVRRVPIGLADDAEQRLATDSWIGAFIELGSRLRDYSHALVGRQLVLAVSVPRRDYVAALIGTGWMLSAPTPILDAPIDVFRRAERGTPLRAVTERGVVTGAFGELDESRGEARVRTGGKTYFLSWIRAVSELNEESNNRTGNVPDAGFLAAQMGAASTWLERVTAPPADLALVGTKAWLREDLEALIGNGADETSHATQLANYVLPRGPRVATWSTPVIASARLGEGRSLPDTCELAVLDRFGAIKYLNDIAVPIVVCVVDRSIADESAAELLIEARLSNSHPISVVDDLHWKPALGIEALAFTVAL